MNAKNIKYLSHFCQWYLQNLNQTRVGSLQHHRSVTNEQFHYQIGQLLVCQ